ncbi:hypothetical protein [Sphingomonas sp.]|uniref:hypothetical protein n=1 Tax=Sphingomonas sp. TaxID=28214 RepID=UPI001DE0AF83|nr:hypothetical protein [Sphingomonas sp.]MBX9796848.1 hypothetical protein [Sphingomonas sp.]
MPLPLRALAATALCWPAVAQAAFAPPLDQPLRHQLVEERTTAGTIQRFTSTRMLRFSRIADGYRVQVEIVANDTAAGAAGDLFGWMMSAFAGRTLNFRLDANGALVAVDDADAHWNRLCDTIAAIPGQSRDRTEKLRALAAQLRAAPAASRLRMLGSIVTGVIAADAAEMAAGTRAVQVPVAGAVPLPGVQRVLRAGNRIRVEVSAEGDLSLGDAAGRIAWHPTREADAATGMLLNERSERRITLAGRPGAAAPTTTVVVTATLDRVS